MWETYLALSVAIGCCVGAINFKRDCYLLWPDMGDIVLSFVISCCIAWVAAIVWPLVALYVLIMGIAFVSLTSRHTYTEEDPWL